MKKIVFICLQKEIIEDLAVAALMDMDGDIDLHCFDTVKDIEINVAGLNPDLIVLSYDALKTKDSWKFKNIPIAYHAKNKEELAEGARYGFPTIGIGIAADDILNNLKKPVYQPQIEIKSEKKNDLKENSDNPLKKFSDKPQKSKKEGSQVSIKKIQELDDLVQNELSNEEYSENEDMSEDELEEYDDLSEENLLEEYDLSENNETKSENEEISRKKDTRTLVLNKPDRKNLIEEGFKRDSGKVRNQTQVITVYSAKGGVGKTTIASELATYLSLVNVGRRKLRTCIVDYNIDFGDVRSTIHMNADGMTLTNWAEEVQELMQKGKEPEDIYYSKADIEEWLRRDKKSGLYVLPAPITNEDSMGIKTTSLSVILNNIVENGEFDFVICDTGNNTRDSTMVALEKATTILLIMTQNVNTANCDKAFIETMKSIDFDLSHVKLVINNIMPQKSTSVSVQEIIEFFPYDCVGKLKFNTDVIKAGNLGEPLAFHPEHEFTKQLRNIVSYILQESNFNSDAESEKKKSLFERIFRKK